MYARHPNMQASSYKIDSICSDISRSFLLILSEIDRDFFIQNMSAFYMVVSLIPSTRILFFCRDIRDYNTLTMTDTLGDAAKDHVFGDLFPSYVSLLISSRRLQSCTICDSVDSAVACTSS